MLEYPKHSVEYGKCGPIPFPSSGHVGGGIGSLAEVVNGVLMVVEMVEVSGIEPLSKLETPRPTTSVVYFLYLIQLTRNKQTQLNETLFNLIE